MRDVLQLLFYLLLGGIPPFFLLAVWRRWQRKTELIIGVILVPFLGGLLGGAFGTIFGLIHTDQEQATGQRRSVGGPYFWIVVGAFAYSIFGVLVTLGSLFFWGCVWYVWRIAYPESFWKMVYFRHQDRADILKDYDEQIKPEPRPEEQTKTNKG